MNMKEMHKAVRELEKLQEVEHQLIDPWHQGYFAGYRNAIRELLSNFTDLLQDVENGKNG